MAVTKITVFEARDKKTFGTELEAEVHEAKLDVLSIVLEFEQRNLALLDLDDLSDAFLRNLVVVGEKAKTILDGKKAIRVIEKM